MSYEEKYDTQPVIVCMYRHNGFGLIFPEQSDDIYYYYYCYYCCYHVRTFTYIFIRRFDEIYPPRKCCDICLRSICEQKKKKCTSKRVNEPYRRESVADVIMWSCSDKFNYYIILRRYSIKHDPITWTIAHHAVYASEKIHSGVRKVRESSRKCGRCDALNFKLQFVWRWCMRIAHCGRIILK